MDAATLATGRYASLSWRGACHARIRFGVGRGNNFGGTLNRPFEYRTGCCIVWSYTYTSSKGNSQPELSDHLHRKNMTNHLDRQRCTTETVVALTDGRRTRDAHDSRVSLACMLHVGCRDNRRKDRRDWLGNIPWYYKRSRPLNDKAHGFQCLEQRSRSSVTRGSKGGA